MFRGRLKGAAVVLPLVTAVLTFVAPPVFAGEHLRSEVHQNLWYFWSTRYVYYNIQTTGSSGLNVGPGALLDGESIRDAAGRAFSAWASQPCTDMQFYFAGFTADRGSNMTSDDINGKNSIIFRYEDWQDQDCRDAIACTTVVTRRAWPPPLNRCSARASSPGTSSTGIGRRRRISSSAAAVRRCSPCRLLPAKRAWPRPRFA
jgi:hypothetical protein